MTRILVADDNSQVRRVLRNLVEQDKDWEVCGEAIDGKDAVQRAKETNPDLIVLNFQMPVMNWLQAAREIAKVSPGGPDLALHGASLTQSDRRSPTSWNPRSCYQIKGNRHREWH